MQGARCCGYLLMTQSFEAAALKARAQRAHFQRPLPLAASGLVFGLLSLVRGAALGRLTAPELNWDLAPCSCRNSAGPGSSSAAASLSSVPNASARGCATRWVVGQRQPQHRPTARPGTKGKWSSTPRTCWKHLFQSRFCICSVRNNA